MVAPCLFWVKIPMLLFVGAIYAEACTRYDYESGTCYIDRSQKWNSSDGIISCDSSYPNCVITCHGDKYSCGSEEDTAFPHIACGEHGNKCTINCNSNEACYGSTIYTGNYSLVNININAMDQSKMEIYAPNHGTLDIHLLSEYTSFTNNKIHSSPSTASIYMDCRHGISCNKNVIDGQYITSSLIYKCDSYCDSTHILCPIDAPCDIHCRHSCNNMLISSEDINELHFLCDYKQCKNTMIECVVNDTIQHSQFISNYNNNGIGSLVGHCTDSRSSDEFIEFSADLNVYIYFNQSDRFIDYFTKLMHDAIIETYDIISDNDPKHWNISGHIINITFCVMFNEIISNQCDTFAMNKSTPFVPNPHESEFVAFGLFNIVSTDVDIMLFKQYVTNIVSSDKFLTYFTQTMNVKLFSTDDFHTLAIHIDDSVIVMKRNGDIVDVDDKILTISRTKASYPAHMVIVFIIIGLCGGTICSILCAYSVRKWCNSEYLLQKLESDLQKIEKKSRDMKLTQNNKNILHRKHPPKIRAFHWGFTNGNDKYGEVSKFAKEESPSESLPPQNSEHRQRNHTFSNDVHRNSYSTRNRTSIDSSPKPTELNPQERERERESIALKASTSIKDMPALQQIASEDGNLYEEDPSHFGPQQTFNMEEALKQNGFHSKYKRMRHFKTMKSISSMEIEDLFNSPTISHMEGPKIRKGHTMAASYDAMYNYGAFNNVHDVDQLYANTMPAFSLHPIEISQINASTMEKMDDDFDDYDDENTRDSNNTENQSSSPKQSTSCTSTPDDDKISSESSLDEHVTPTITPLLGPHYGNNNFISIGFEDKLSKLSDDTEPELPLSPCHSPCHESDESAPSAGNIPVPIAYVCNPHLMQIERSKCVVINVNVNEHDASCTKYDTPSYSSTKL